MLTVNTSNVINDYIMARSSYHHGRLRETLVAHGVLLLAQKGIEGLSLRTLARKAGVSPAAPYRHFKNAQALAEAIAAEGFGRLRSAMLETMADPQLAERTPLERIGFGYLRFAQRNPDHFQLMFSGRVCPDPELPESELHHAGQAAFQGLTETIVEAQRLGLLAADVSAAELTVVSWCFIHGFATLTLAGFLDPKELDLKMTQDELADACQKLIRRGWGTPAAKARYR